jgi:hypothetical protein
MLKVEYRRDGTSVDKKIRTFLGEHGFDFKLALSETYCRNFFGQLDEEERKDMLSFLSEFVQQPFVKMKTVRPDLISRIFSSDGVYLYWIRSPRE